MTNWRRSSYRAPIAAAVIAMAAALLAVAWQVVVNRNPDPCDRSQAMRDVLERATGRDCDIITDDDLADISQMAVSGGPLQRFDFAGLDNLLGLNLERNDLTELPPGVFDGLTNLQNLDLLANPGAPFTITHPKANLNCKECRVVRR